MTRIFDASAVLAAIFDEPGGGRVTELWSDGENLLCTVNYAEVVAKLAERGMTDAEVRVVMEGVPLKLAEFDQETALAAGLLRRAVFPLSPQSRTSPRPIHFRWEPSGAAHTISCHRTRAMGR